MLHDYTYGIFLCLNGGRVCLPLQRCEGFLKLHFIYLFFACVHLCATVCMQRSKDNLQEVVPSFHHSGAGELRWSALEAGALTC